MPECGLLPLLGSSPNLSTRQMNLRATAPSSVDLRTQGLDGPVKDQQQVGVCWAFALSTIMENGVRRQGRGDVVAPLHLVATDAFDDLWRKGGTDGPMTLEASWPYDPPKACKLKSLPEPWCEDAYHVKQGSWREDPVLVGEVDRANRSGIVAVTKVEKLTPLSFDAVAEVLAGGQSAYLGFKIDDAAWKRPQGGIVADYAVGNGGGHAVVAVGYRTDGPRGREILIHNSWGPSWGDRGYAWVSENTLRQHGIDGFVVDVRTTGPPAPPVSSGAIPSPFGIPGIPGFGGPAPSGGQPSGNATVGPCAAGQINDLLTNACTKPCPNGLPPAGGVCMPF